MNLPLSCFGKVSGDYRIIDSEGLGRFYRRKYYEHWIQFNLQNMFKLCTMESYLIAVYLCDMGAFSRVCPKSWSFHFGCNA